jgi:hypothetical protein
MLGRFASRTGCSSLANALKQHHVGLEETADDVWSLYLGHVLLGRIDERTMKVHG